MALYTYLKDNRKTSYGGDWESHKNSEMGKKKIVFRITYDQAERSGHQHLAGTVLTILCTLPRVNHCPPHFTEKETEPWRG